MTAGASPVEHDARAPRCSLAIVSDHFTPYRAHLHRRILRELPAVELHSVFVATQGQLSWDVDLPEAANAVFFEGGPDPIGGRLPGLAAWRKARAILAHLHERAVDTVLVNGYQRPSMIALLLLARSSGLRVFLRGDSNIAGDRPRTPLHALAKQAFLRTLLSRCDGVMPMGRLGQAYFERYGAAPERCYLVPYEPDVSRFAEPDAERVRAVAARLGGDVRRLLFVGRLVPVKRVDALLGAFARIAASRTEWHLAIVGDGPLREELRSSVPVELEERVHWTGFLDVDDVRAAHHASDVLVLPSDLEPWGVVVNEAVAAGLVVVASDTCGAAHELVVDGTSGRVFPAGDVDALSAALLQVTAPDELERLRAGTGPALRDWQRRGDPIAGLRRALASEDGAA